MIDKENPKVFAFCETWLTKNDNFEIRDYIIERKDRTEQRGGGLAICIHNSMQYRKIKLNEKQNNKIETIAIKISYKKKWLNILLIYNPCNNIEQQEIEHYTEQLQNPKLIIGDFNAHHPLWNPNNNIRTANKTGINLYNFITQNNLMLITPPGLITRIDPKTGKGSTIDLVIGSPELSHLEIKTNTKSGSDHLPIILNDDNQITETHTKESTWKFNNEGWKNFQVELTNKDIKGIKSITELIDIIKNCSETF